MSTKEEKEFDIDSDEFSLDLPTEEEADANNAFSVPDGEYAAVVIDLEKQYSKAGNPMWVWDFELLADNPEDPHFGKQFRAWTALTPAAMWKVAEFLEALELGKPGEKVKFKKSDVINRRALLSMVQEDYTNDEGRTFRNSKVDQVLPHPDGAIMPKQKRGKKAAF
ncbi:hypothetical protein LCGC14_2251370 [marine sediment metagenome]|uniref:DUF669 domain-containing protein n=1 Tax=marine sediment metagenome TaxID=412755 RepID=A0A0F9FXI3_9ZZZZ